MLWSGMGLQPDMEGSMISKQKLAHPSLASTRKTNAAPQVTTTGRSGIELPSGNLGDLRKPCGIPWACLLDLVKPIEEESYRGNPVKPVGVP